LPRPSLAPVNKTTFCAATFAMLPSGSQKDYPTAVLPTAAATRFGETFVSNGASEKQPGAYCQKK
jgi:hypothetical protein